MKLGIWILVALFFVLGLADLGLNLLSLLPYVGSAFETLAESVLELLQAVIMVIVAIMYNAAAE
jgi:hypothetical protein